MTRIFSFSILLALAVVTLTVTSACQTSQHMINRVAGSGSLAFVDGEDNVWYAPTFDTAIYRAEGKHHASVLLIAGTLDEPECIVHARMFFAPIGGETPQDAQSTNTVVRAVIFQDDGEMAVLGGGGMMFPYGDVGSDTMTANLRETALRVLDQSEGYAKPDHAIAFRGSFQVTRNEEQFTQMIREVQQVVTEKLGRPRVVEVESDALDRS